MPIQVDGALVHAPCPVPSCPACEPNTGSVHPKLPAKAARVEASRHCYAIKWVLGRFLVPAPEPTVSSAARAKSFLWLLPRPTRCPSTAFHLTCDFAPGDALRT